MADKVQEHDKQVLHKLGYAQELSRRMSGFSNFAISFSIINILAGGISAFSCRLQFRQRRRCFHWLAGWWFFLSDGCIQHGPDRLCLPYGWRLVSLGFNPRWKISGMDGSLV